jgi:hypothetical protein
VSDTPDSDPNPLLAAAWYGLMHTPPPDLKRATATGVAMDTWFELTCPYCGTLTLVSLYARDGAMNECDGCPNEFWFYAGDFASARKQD